MQIEWTRFAHKDRAHLLEFIAQYDTRASIAVDRRIVAAIEVLSRFHERGRVGRVAETRELSSTKLLT